MYRIVESRNDNTIETDGMKCSILIQYFEDLNDLPLDVNPGSIAYTADFKGIYCKDVDGTWITVRGRK